MDYKTRTLENFFVKAGKMFPVLIVTGARQVGKTTFLKHLKEDKRSFVTLDDPLLKDLAKRDPALFLKRFPAPLIIDEIQYAPELLSYIKMDSDQTKEKSRFWLTGSQQFHLMKNVSESLAGRVGIFNLQGLSEKEVEGQGSEVTPFLPSDFLKKNIKGRIKPLKEIYRRIWDGSFPGLVLNHEMDRNLFYSSYINTYLQRDLKDLSKVGDELAFFHFLKAVAARSGQLLNFADLARDAGISPNTAKSWLSILVTSGIAYLLEPWHSNLTKRIVKAPKIYFLDTGLCGYLTEWTTSEALEAGAMTGAIFETWIISEILKSYWHNGLQPPVYFYRDTDGKEIDLLIIKDRKIIPVEIKRTASPDQKSIRHFKVLEKTGLSTDSGALICLSEISFPLEENVHVIPAGWI